MPHGTKKLDIAVCGCGPAGLAAAVLLARAGHRVRIFDQFATPRPIGSGLILQPTGLAVLAELELLNGVAALGTPVERLFGRAVPSNKVVLDVRYDALAPGSRALAVHRSALFDVLHDAARAAAIEIVASTRVAAVESDVLLATGGRRLGAFDLIVNALGANSTLADRELRRTVLPYGALWTTVALPAGAGFAPHALEQRYRRASRMAGVLPIGRRTIGGRSEAAFFWSLKRTEVAEWGERGVDRWKEEVRALWPEARPLLDEVRDCADMTFAQYDHFTVRQPCRGRLVHIGDAAHSTSPQLGQGANMALLDAYALARAIETKSDVAEALSEYARMRRWHVRLFQWASAIFTPFYQSDSRVLPFIRDQLTAPLSRLPIADALLARLVSGMTVPAIAGVSLPYLTKRERASGGLAGRAHREYRR